MASCLSILSPTLLCCYQLINLRDMYCLTITDLGSVIFKSLEMWRCPCYWRWEKQPGTIVGPLRMSGQPHGHFLGHNFKNRDQRKTSVSACLGLSKAFDKVKGSTGKFSGPMYKKKRGNSFATVGGDFYTNSAHTQDCK